MYHILYIDSQEADLTQFRGQFSNFYQIFTAQSMGEAFSIISENNVNLIICGFDIQDEETQQLFKQINRLQPTPVLILLTDFSGFSHLKEIINQNKILKVVSKPYDVDDLGMILHNALNSYQLGLDNSQLKLLTDYNHLQLHIFNALEDGVYLVSSDYKIIFINRAMIKIIGHDVIGLKCYKAIFNLDDICLGCQVKEFAPKGDRFSSEVEYKGKKYLKSYTFFEDGSRLTVYHDITQVKKSMDILENKTEELELFNESMVNREIRMIELKEEVNRLAQELGREIVYSELWKEVLNDK